MKKIIILLISLVFVLNIISVSVAQESEQLRILKYQTEKKDGWIAAAIPLVFLSSLGHAYAGDWNRGLWFLGGKILSAAIYISSSAQVGGAYTGTQMANSTLATISGVGLLALYIWEPIDAYQTAEDTNKQLRKKYNLDISFYNNRPIFRVSYQF